MGMQRVVDIIAWQRLENKSFSAKVFLECGHYTIVMFAREDAERLGSFMSMPNKIRQLFPRASCEFCAEAGRVNEPLTIEEWQDAMDKRFHAQYERVSWLKN